MNMTMTMKTIMSMTDDPGYAALDIREGMDVAAGVKDGKIIFIEES